jgi:hypothetical protein
VVGVHAQYRLGHDMLPNKSSEFMGHHTLVYLPISLCLDNHSRIFPIGTLKLNRG